MFKKLKYLNWKNLFRTLGIQLITLLTQTTFVWVSGYILIELIAGMDFFNPIEMLFVMMWIKIIYYHLRKVQTDQN